jgi:hypothetical protein
VETALNAFFEILSFGAIIVLVVLGLGVIASMMGIFNFAHGEFVLLGAYTTYLVSRSGLPVWIGMLVAPFVVAAIGLIVERLVIRRFYRRPDRRHAWHLRSWPRHPRDGARADRWPHAKVADESMLRSRQPKILLQQYLPEPDFALDAGKSPVADFSLDDSG